MSRDLSEYAPDGANNLVWDLQTNVDWALDGDPAEDWMYRQAREIAHRSRPTLLALERLAAVEAEVRMWKAMCLEGGLLIIEAMDMISALQAERKEREDKP